MYLIIDEQYRIYKAEILSGKIRSLARKAKLSVVNLSTMQGINSAQWSDITVDESLPEWSDIQDLPSGFEVDAEH